MTDLAVEALRAMGDLEVTASSVPLPGPWIARARCRTAPASLFFPGRGDDVDQARQICLRCPVLEDCRAYAVEHPLLQGTWGALTGRERRNLREARARAVADAVAAGPEEERPAHSPRNTLYRTLVELTAHPGRWARVAHFTARGSAQAMASRLRNGYLLAPPGQWTFEGRRSDEEGSDLYALYEPPTEAFDPDDEDDVAVRRLLGLEAS